MYINEFFFTDDLDVITLETPTKIKILKEYFKFRSKKIY